MIDAPVEDLQNQQLPRNYDLRIGHEHPADLPLADLLEQELPEAEAGDLPTAVDVGRLEGNRGQ